MPPPISDLTLMVTQDCNFDCRYCFVNKHPVNMDAETARRALGYFIGSGILTRDALIYFNGGEPLLNLGLIEEVVDFIKRVYPPPVHRFRFGISTNGSRVNPQTLDFLVRHRFLIGLSFDGLAQDQNRKEGSFGFTLGLIQEIIRRCPDRLMVNAVYTPDTVECLADSLALILDLGVTDAGFSLNHREAWTDEPMEKMESQYRRVEKLVKKQHARTGRIPVHNYRRTPRGIKSCSAGRDQLTVLPGGEIWGCLVIAEYFNNRRDRFFRPRDFCGGTLDDTGLCRPGNIHRFGLRHRFFRMDECRTGTGGKKWCFRCPQVEECFICPFSVAPLSGQLGLIPDFACRLSRMSIESRHRVWKELPGG